MRLNFTQRTGSFFRGCAATAIGLLLYGAGYSQATGARNQAQQGGIQSIIQQKHEQERRDAPHARPGGDFIFPKGNRTGAGSKKGATPTTEVTYCVPPATNCGSSDVITRVRLNLLDNASGCPTTTPAGYSNYTATLPATTIYTGAPNPITVNVPTTFTEQLAVWIDYNQNGLFEVTEFTNLGSSSGTLGNVAGVINIPATALTGNTVMRVRVRFSTALNAGDACIGYTFGETEDYTVNIQPCVPVSFTGNPANATTSCGGNASFTANIAGSAIAYQWQYKATPASGWLNIPAGAPYSGEKTATLSLTNVSQAFNGYQYRIAVTGACSAAENSGGATLTVNQAVPVVNTTPASICDGGIAQLSLTNTITSTELIAEGFNTVSPLPAGWVAQNNSTPVGTTGWFQGNTTVFSAQSGAANSYIGANFNNVTGANTISNWLITPTVAIKNGDIFRFWSRKVSGSTDPDRLEVRLNASNTTNVGTTNTSVGDFTNLLLTINPTLTVAGYPTVWTEYVIVVSGLTAPIPAGRFAFRYFVTNGGPAGTNSDYIGIDNVGFTSVGGTVEGTWDGPAGTMWTDAAATMAYTPGSLATTIWVTPNVSSDYSVSFNTITCASATTTVPVKVFKPAVLEASPVNTAACDGGTATFTATATGGPVTYQWQRSTDGGLTYTDITGATASTFTLSGITRSMSGYLYRCVISAAPCTGSLTTAAAILTVNALPVVTLTATDVFLTPGQPATISASSVPAAAAGGWAWSYNGSVIAGNNTSTLSGITFVSAGTYKATVTDINGCSATSNGLVIGSEASDRLWIYPNPTKGKFQVRLYHDPSGPFEKRTVYVFNSQGQLITSAEFDLANTSAPYLQMDFDLSKSAPGTYVIKAAHKYSGKIVSGLVMVQ